MRRTALPGVRGDRVQLQQLIINLVINGIDPANPNRLFDAFYTTKSGGMGLGLSICRSIVDAHGGRIWAANHGGGGAVFSFTLPDPAGRATAVVAPAVPMEV